ncbi:o-methyltransferas-like protein [Byssothecium circinans]|uniref:O-methyltransferas-like protein n=1 Tax=Byssothecium circinans TaxID=147558 RepID=A0A6A5TD95_9PLEO|nr:o-methyltransferas-like protein [Byssothecium circinans]
MDALLESVTAEVQKVVGTADEALRQRTMNKLRDLQYSLETPEHTMQRLIYTGLTTASIRVSLDLKIFNQLAESDRSLTINELSESADTDPILLGRLLRHQASLGIIRQTAQDEFTHSQTTKNLSIPDIQSGIFFCNDVLDPAYHAMPTFLAERKYRNPNELLDTPFNTAWSTKMPLWDWLSEHPEHRSHFDRFMVAQRSSVKNCFSFLSLDKECENWPAERPVFVDVGGGTGQQCIALKEKFPELPGTVILQDLPTVVAGVELPEGIKVHAYDFFTPQPVKGAKYYYLRAIMHDHADDKCLEILKNIVDAMTDESTLLLDEIVVPDQDVDWFVTQTDLAMMVQFSSMERTEEQWRRLLSEAGLKVREIITYTHSFRLSIIVATK